MVLSAGHERAPVRLMSFIRSLLTLLAARHRLCAVDGSRISDPHAQRLSRAYHGRTGWGPVVYGKRCRSKWAVSPSTARSPNSQLPQWGLNRTASLPVPDGALWFTDSSAAAVGRITTSGVVTKFPAERTCREPARLCGQSGRPRARPDGAIWTFMNSNTAVFPPEIIRDHFRSHHRLSTARSKRPSVF